MKNYTQQQTYVFHVLTFWGCVIAIGASLFLYAFYVNTAVMHTASRSKLNTEISELKSSVSEYELAYIQESRNINADLATTYGLVATNLESVQFVKADTRLTLRNE